MEKQHWTVAEIAERWQTSDDFVRELFAEEEGVLNLWHKKPGRQRLRRHLRIPHSVLLRVENRLKTDVQSRFSA